MNSGSAPLLLLDMAGFILLSTKAIIVWFQSEDRRNKYYLKIPIKTEVEELKHKRLFNACLRIILIVQGALCSESTPFRRRAEFCEQLKKLLSIKFIEIHTTL